MFGGKTTHLEITTKTIIYTVIGAFVLYLLYIIRDVIINLFIAFIFMSALRPSVDNLESRGVPRSVAAISVLLLVISVLATVFYYAIPPLLVQTGDFFIYATRQLFDLLHQLDSNLTVKDLFPIETVSRNIPNITNTITQTIFSLFGNILDIVALFFFTLYFLLDIKNIKENLRRFLNEGQTKFATETLTNIEKQLGAWVRGELVLMVIIGIMSYVGLTILGVKYALPLAVIAGLLEVVPIVGPIISAIPAFFVAATSSWLSGAAVIALYTIIQQLENNLIVPMVMRKAVGLSPLIVLISLVIGQRLTGVTGAILAVPVVAAATIIVQEIVKYREKKMI